MIVDWCYFNSDFMGEGVQETDFPRLSLRAEDMINHVTGGALDSYEEMHDTDKELVRKAICSQVEYYAQFSLSVGFPEGSEGFTVGKVSVQSGQGFKNFICPVALAYLESAGLLTRAVGVRC